MRTYQAKKDEIERKWYLVNAEDVPLGRLATQVALMLRGKDKATFTRHVDTGGFVVVVNATKVKLTGKKSEQKLYYRHSQKPGGLKEVAARELVRKDPVRLVSHAVRGMLPKSSLGRKQLGKLKVYPGELHPHGAQRPEEVEIKR